MIAYRPLIRILSFRPPQREASEEAAMQITQAISRISTRPTRGASGAWPSPLPNTARRSAFACCIKCLRVLLRFRPPRFILDSFRREATLHLLLLVLDVQLVADGAHARHLPGVLR